MMTNKLAVVALTRDKAQIWKLGIEPGTHPEAILPPDVDSERRVQKTQRSGGRDKGHSDPEYFEEIAQSLKGFGRILFFGHGEAKGNEAFQLKEYLEKKHPDIAKIVVDSLRVDLENLSEGEILALARKWVASHPL
jgi:hypothetical protein